MAGAAAMMAPPMIDILPWSMITATDGKPAVDDRRNPQTKPNIMMTATVAAIPSLELGGIEVLGQSHTGGG